MGFHVLPFLLLVLAFSAPATAADSLADAQALFYNGHYESAAAMSRALPAAEGGLAVYEFRTAAVLFQLRRAIGDPKDKDKAFKQCASCPDLMTTFMDDLAKGQDVARTILKQQPKDETALFFLGKLDLNYVWLVLGTLGRKTGWNEYWEARHSLDAVLVDAPTHLRARVARAWIDYIVDTRMPWGTGWMLGGGNKKKALVIMHEAADAHDDFYAIAEAQFGLWDMQVREKNFKDALVTAQKISIVFPKNAEVAKFIEARTPASTR